MAAEELMGTVLFLARIAGGWVNRRKASR